MAEGKVVYRAGRKGPVVTGANGVGVPGLNLIVPERLGERRRPPGTGVGAELRHVPQDADAVFLAEVLVSFDAPLIGRSDGGRRN